MKKILTSVVFVLTFAVYGLYQYFSNSSAVAYVAPDKASVAQSTDIGTKVQTTSTPIPISAPKPKGQYTDGTYIGSVADAYYGNVQVQVTVSGSKIANVAFLQYPSDRSTSRYINNQAMPVLKSEAIRAQNAQVNTVSGASDTSGAFRQSLAAALTQAKS